MAIDRFRRCEHASNDPQVMYELSWNRGSRERAPANQEEVRRNAPLERIAGRCGGRPDPTSSSHPNPGCKVGGEQGLLFDLDGFDGGLAQ